MTRFPAYPAMRLAAAVAAARHPSHVHIAEAGAGAISHFAMAAQGLRGWLTRRIEAMTKRPGCVAVTAIGAAIVAATPGFADGAPLANRHYVGGFHDPACFRHHRHLRNFAFVGGPFFYDYAGYGNYCWQQVWTPSGWQWLDACAGYYGFGY